MLAVEHLVEAIVATAAKLLLLDVNRLLAAEATSLVHHGANILACDQQWMRIVDILQQAAQPAPCLGRFVFEALSIVVLLANAFARISIAYNIHLLRGPKLKPSLIQSQSVILSI